MPRKFSVAYGLRVLGNNTAIAYTLNTLPASRARKHSYSLFAFSNLPASRFRQHFYSLHLSYFAGLRTSSA